MRLFLVPWRMHVLSLCALISISSFAQQAPAGSSSSRPKSKTAAAASPDPGTLNDGVYRNSFFGFTYKVPYGWVDRTDRMQGDSEPGKSQVLLATFERPPEAAAETINSAVVIAAESVRSYPGLKSADDYAARVSELTAAKGFKPTSDAQEVLLNSHKLLRVDFTRDIGKLTMRQATLIMLAKGYIATFTFIGGNADEVEELVSGMSFSGRGKAAAKQ